MSKITVAVLLGGCSTEHEVPRVLTVSVIQSIPQDKYDVVPVGITKEGRWLLFSGETAELPDRSWEQNPANRPAFISLDRTVHGILAQTETDLETIPVDVVLPVLHGKSGENGTLKGSLQMAGIPFVGCSSLASAMCMGRAIINSLFETAGIPQAHYLWSFTNNYLIGAEKIQGKIEARLGYPILVKPTNFGSSTGVSKVTRPEDLDVAIQRTAREGTKVVVEEAIAGQEVERAVLGLSRPEASIVGEIVSGVKLYDYDDKYRNGVAKPFILTHIPEETAEEVRENVLRAYRMLGYSGFTHVDFFARKNGGAALLNELNTLPGFISISMYPKLWEISGLSYSELLNRPIRLAFEKVYF